MKRFWCIFTLCAILSGAVFTLLVAGLSLGDVNGNATLDSNDCALIRSAFLGNLTLGREEQSAVDINQNGRADSNDYLLARMAVLGITGPESFYLSGEPDISVYSAEVQAAYAGYASRADTVLRYYYAKPMKADPNWSLPAEALVRLALNTDLSVANQNLRTLCTDYPADTSNTFASYFCMDMILRSYLQYGDRLEAETKTAIENYFLNFLTLNSDLTKARALPTAEGYTVYDSENHHIVQRTAFYLGAAILTDAGKGNTQLSDGNTVSTHFSAWETYLTAYLAVRGKYGVNIENGSQTYMKYTVGALLSLYDFGRNEDLRRLSRNTVDVYMAETVVQTADNSRGGATTRCYKKSASSPLGAAEYYAATFFGTNFNIFKKITYHPALLSAALTTYRPSTYLYDLAVSDLTAEPYTYQAAMPSAGSRDYLGNSRFRYNFTPLKPQAQKTTYVCSDYVLGSLTGDRRSSAGNLVELYQQNKCMSVIFSGDYTAYMDNRVYFTGASEDKTGYNEIDGVSEKSAMIVVHCSEALETTQFIMYASSAFTFTEHDGWMVAQEPKTGAYIAVYGVGGTPSQTTSTIKNIVNGLGVLYSFDDAYKAAVVQCAPADAYASVDDFASALPHVFFNTKTRLVTYRSLDGDVLTYNLYRSAAPTVNGKAVDFESGYLYRSPYLNSIYGSGVVTVTDTRGKTYEITF